LAQALSSELCGANVIVDGVELDCYSTYCDPNDSAGEIEMDFAMPDGGTCSATLRVVDIVIEP
jgi:hypothetical protein